MTVDRFKKVEKKAPSLSISPPRKYIRLFNYIFSAYRPGARKRKRAYARRYTNRERLIIRHLVVEALWRFNGTKGVGKYSDEGLWASIAWAVGPKDFACAIDYAMERAKAERPRNPPAFFTQILKDLFPKPEKGGAK